MLARRAGLAIIPISMNALTTRRFLLSLGLGLVSQLASAQEAKPAVQPAAAAETKPAAALIKVVFETSKGTIELELDSAKAPITVANFVKYVKSGHYDGTIFHRCIPNFMIQGGGFLPSMDEKMAGEMIKNEGQNGLKNDRGTIAMARRGDPDSASAQFFINVKDNAGLNYPSPDGHGYAVFGKVTKGMDVADAIVAVSTTQKGPHGDVPVEPILINSAKIAE
jgi:cyclophilin family peptidyl-prolyl cis-trans isomerase